MPAFPYQKVKNQEDHLLNQEVIVDKGVDRNSQCQRSLLSVPGQLLISGQHQREKGHSIMKVMENQIHGLKS